MNTLNFIFGSILFNLSLMKLSRIHSFFSWIAAKDSKACLLRDASARNACTYKMSNLTRNIAGINLKLTTHTSPAHSIIIVVTALNRTSTTLIVKQDASYFLYNTILQNILIMSKTGMINM